MLHMKFLDVVKHQNEIEDLKLRNIKLQDLYNNFLAGKNETGFDSAVEPEMSSVVLNTGEAPEDTSSGSVVSENYVFYVLYCSFCAISPASLR